MTLTRLATWTAVRDLDHLERSRPWGICQYLLPFLFRLSLPSKHTRSSIPRRSWSWKCLNIRRKLALLNRLVWMITCAVLPRSELDHGSKTRRRMGSMHSLVAPLGRVSWCHMAVLTASFKIRSFKAYLANWNLNAQTKPLTV